MLGVNKKLFCDERVFADHDVLTLDWPGERMKVEQSECGRRFTTPVCSVITSVSELGLLVSHYFSFLRELPARNDKSDGAVFCV